MDFNQIPEDLRVPLAYIEFDNSRANAGAVTSQHRRLLIGQMLATGSATAGQLIRVTRPDQGLPLFGEGAMLTEMVRATLETDQFIETWAIALEDDAAGNAATGTIKITSAPTAAGTLALYIAGQRVRIGVAADDAVADVATAVAAAVNALGRLPVTASATTDTVTLTCRWKGETGNDIDVRANYYPGEVLPAGLALTITAMSGGTANPDIAPAAAGMAGTWFKTVVTPYTDTPNLDALAAELEERWGPVAASDGVAYAAYRGTHSETAAFGEARNDHVMSYFPAGGFPTPPWILAAVNGAVASYYLNQDPARPLQSLELPGVLPPAASDRYSVPERNLLLYSGISSYNVDAAGVVRLDAQITNYQVNSYGSPDPSYLYVNTPATLGALRDRTRNWVTQTFPRHKLRGNGPVRPGSAVVTPEIFRDAYYGGVAKPAEDDGLIENARELVAGMVCEIDSNNPNRLNTLTRPDLVNQFRFYAERMQFRV